MTRVLVLCNHSDNGGILPNTTYDEMLHINATPPQKNLQLHIDNITHRILEQLNPLAQDLLEIAAYVYYADCSVKRVTETDVYADKWQRRFEFVMPVSDPDRWNKEEIKDLLRETMEFLSGDEFAFTFIPPKPTPTQLCFTFPDMPPAFPSADCVCLFSGGLDALVGSLVALKEQREHPLLVSHRSLPKMDSLQKTLVSELRKRNQEWQFPHLSIWINRKGNRAVEMTQRTRSFLYLSIAAATASQLGIGKIYICENGVVSANIPISGQNVGTLLTRSTHPKFLRLFQQFIENLFDANISVVNPFVFFTKTELLSKLETWGQSELMEATVSCSYTQGKTKMQPQCGTCLQCVNRRFSAMAGGLEKYDKREYYEKDVFLDPLQEGKETVCAQGYVRSALEISEMNDMQFFAKYPELDEVVSNLGISAEEGGQKLYDLFQRHANEVIKVVTSTCSKHQRELLVGKLPENCLISMLASRRHLLEPINVYADKIASILQKALPKDFQTEKPKSELRVQESVEAALSAADERLRRECPMLSYSIIQTKPDFANIRDYNRMLFIEIKFLNNRRKLNRIMTEITSRITIYRDQGAFVLFVVYDANRVIKDEDEFVRDLVKHDGINAVVVR